MFSILKQLLAFRNLSSSPKVVFPCARPAPSLCTSVSAVCRVSTQKGGQGVSATGQLPEKTPAFVGDEAPSFPGHPGTSELTVDRHCNSANHEVALRSCYVDGQWSQERGE